MASFRSVCMYTHTHTHIRVWHTDTEVHHIHRCLFGGGRIDSSLFLGVANLNWLEIDGEIGHHIRFLSSVERWDNIGLSYLVNFITGCCCAIAPADGGIWQLFLINLIRLL